MIRLLQTLILIAAVGAAGFFVLRALRPAEEDPDQNLTTAVADVGDIVREVRFIGSVIPVLITEVKSEVSGRVVEVHVDNGDEVEEGQVLIRLDPREISGEIEELQREMNSVRLRVERARRDYERISGLHEREFATDQQKLDAATELALMENDLEVRQARLDTLNDRLSRLTILAPHDGIVLNLDISPGRVLVGASGVAEGDVPLEIADLRRMRVEARVSELDLAYLRTGQDATLTFGSIPGLEVPAEVVHISPSAEGGGASASRRQQNQPETVLFPVSLSFAVEDERVRPGISAMVTIEAERSDGVVTAPISAVFYERAGSYVFRRDGAESPWEKMRVEVGLAGLRRVEIREGLDEGDELALGVPSEFVEPGGAASED